MTGANRTSWPRAERFQHLLKCGCSAKRAMSSAYSPSLRRLCRPYAYQLCTQSAPLSIIIITINCFATAIMALNLSTPTCRCTELRKWPLNSRNSTTNERNARNSKLFTKSHALKAVTAVGKCDDRWVRERSVLQSQSIISDLDLFLRGCSDWLYQVCLSAFLTIFRTVVTLTLTSFCSKLSNHPQYVHINSNCYHLNGHKITFLTTFGLVMTVTDDLMTSKFNQFTTHKCT